MKIPEDFRPYMQLLSAVYDIQARRYWLPIHPSERVGVKILHDALEQHFPTWIEYFEWMKTQRAKIGATIQARKK